MLVTEDTLRAVDDHWAVLAIGAKERDRGLEVAEVRLVRAATGRQMALQFKDKPTDDDLLERLAMAYEMAAAEGLDALLHSRLGKASEGLQSQAQAGASRAFSLLRLVPVPDDTSARVFHILHLASLAYCGDRWPDLRSSFKTSEIVYRMAGELH